MKYIQASIINQLAEILTTEWSTGALHKAHHQILSWSTPSVKCIQMQMHSEQPQQSASRDLECLFIYKAQEQTVRNKSLAHYHENFIQELDKFCTIEASRGQPQQQVV